MTAGIFLDALIEEAVFRNSVAWLGNFSYIPDRMPAGHGSDVVAIAHSNNAIVPEYSTDISAAWQVLASRSVGGWCPSLHMQDDGSWYCEIKLGFNTSYTKAVGDSGATAPQAICLAALKALGIEAEQ